MRLGEPKGFPVYTVARLDPERALVLLNSDPAFTAAWQFILRPGDTTATRLIVRTRARWKPDIALELVNNLLIPPGHFIMERKMLLTIKALAEGERR